jgi:hypothetical protein
MPEELKKECKIEEEFIEELGKLTILTTKNCFNEFYYDEVVNLFRKYLAKQQEEFVKCIPEEKDYKVGSDGEYHFADNMKTDGYNQCIADIKSKLK